MAKTQKLRLPKGTKVPDHIAIIPDGNRRWARARGLHTLKGHKQGFKRAIEVGRASRRMGITTATIWGFSTENWDRTAEEINYLMKLYHKLIDDYLEEAKKEKIRLTHFGRKDRLPNSLLKKIRDAEYETRKYRKYYANIALDYGGQDDILRAVRKMIKERVKPEDVDEKLFETFIDSHEQPYPYVDLMIRTSGEQRTSGFLLWQSAYTEYYWENDHFPDFDAEKLKDAVLDYSRRRRRFGGNDAEEHFKFRPELTARLEINWWRLQNIPQGTKFPEYVAQHVIEQFGVSKTLAKVAARHLIQGAFDRKNKHWGKAALAMGKFYKLIHDEIKLAFEPTLAASLQVKLWKETCDEEKIENAAEARNTARQLYAEVYRISLFQAAKLAHLRVLANIERNLAEKGRGDYHWDRAEDYLEKFYSALKERVA